MSETNFDPRKTPAPKQVYIFLFDGFSDWEISYLGPEINKSEGFIPVYFSVGGGPVTSAGGLQIHTTVSLVDSHVDQLDLLVLPGGPAFETGENTPITPLVRAVFESGKPIAAICGATAFLGQLGLLNELKHTSNALPYLRAMAPQYHGTELYLDKLAVTDQNLITASGIAPIEFAREVFQKLGLYDPAAIERWYQLFKNGIWTA